MTTQIYGGDRRRSVREREVTKKRLSFPSQPEAPASVSPNLLQPGDFLHLLTAAGLALLVWYHRHSPHASSVQSR